MLDTLTPLDTHPKHGEVVYVAYLIHHVESGKVYVGSSGTPQRRISRHYSNLKLNKHPNPVFQAYYDVDPKLRHVLYQVGSREEAFALEQALLDYFAADGRLINHDLDAISQFKSPRQVEARLRRYEIDSKPVMADGVRYESQNDCARKIGISIPTIHWRIQSHKAKYTGWYFEGQEKVSTGHNYSKDAVLIEYEGKQISIRELSALSGVGEMTLRSRLNRGIKPADLLKPVIKQYTAKGRTQSLKDWAAEVGINYTTLYARMNNKGMSFEEAIKN